MKKLSKIGFGGGCHWCTEAVFQSLIGVHHVEQGWIGSINEYQTLSEAVIVSYDPTTIPLEILVEIHLYTHQSTSQHSMRKKYRSAIYYFDESEVSSLEGILIEKQEQFDKEIITQILPYQQFKASREAIQNYYTKNPQKPFCKKYIEPKLNLLVEQYSIWQKKDSNKEPSYPS